MAKAFLVALLIPFLAPMDAQADLMLDTYKILRATNRPRLEAWVDGAMSGMSWMNEYSKRSKTHLYCDPEHYAIGPGAAIELIDNYLPKYATLNTHPDRETPVGLILFMALRNAFPCTQSR